MGGKGSGPHLSPKKALERRNRSVGHLYPKAVQKLGQVVESGDPATLRWVIEMHDGKPRQQVDTHLTGEVLIRVVYEEPPEEKQGGEP